MNTTFTNPIYKVRFSTRGRVTIPAPLRRQHGIKAGNKWRIRRVDEGILFERLKLMTTRQK